jgi:hypothetical protein
MKDLSHLNQYRVPHPMTGMMGDNHNGMFQIQYPKGLKLTILASNGEGWDHVSVSTHLRCPTWEEMCFVKKEFFSPEECVVQYHPSEKDYVNFHPHCLHLWRWQGGDFPMPPKEMIA